MVRPIHPSPGRPLLAGLFGLVAILLLLATLAGLLSDAHWLLLLTTHFRPHLFLLALPFALLALLLHFRLPAIGFLAVVLVNGWFLLQVWLQHAPEVSPEAEGLTLRVMTFNINYGSRDFAALEDEIAAADPDLLFLSEVVTAHAPLMRSLAERYPYAALPGATGGQGEALFSRHPVGGLQRIAPSQQASLWIVELALPDGPLTLYGGHPLPAMSGRLDEIHLGWFAAADAALAGRPDERRILLGDLNATPWSPRLLALMLRHDLFWTAPLAGSWPASLPPWLGLPIDHVLVGPGIDYLDGRLGAAAGSDHRPVIVDLLVLDRRPTQ